MNGPCFHKTTILLILFSIIRETLPFDNNATKLDSIELKPFGWNHNNNWTKDDFLIQKIEANVPVIKYWEWFSVGKEWDTLSYKFTSHDSLEYFWNCLDSTISQTLVEPEVSFNKNMLVLIQPKTSGKHYKYSVKIFEDDSSISFTIKDTPLTNRPRVLISITPLMAFELPISNKRVKVTLDRSAYSRWHQK